MSTAAADTLDPRPMKPFEVTPDAARAAQVAFVRLMKLWGVRDPDAARLLGHTSPRTYQRWKAGEYRRSLSVDALERVSNILGIHKALGILFESKAQRDGWVSRPNGAFGGASALEVMLGGRLVDLMRVRRYVDAIRGG